MAFRIRRGNEDFVGRILTHVVVSNPPDPSKQIEFEALVDTGAYGLTLPMTWKEQLEPFVDQRPAELEMADQRTAPGEVAGPVSIQLRGFPRISGEVVFIEVPADAEFEPLVGYMVLEASNAAV